MTETLIIIVVTLAVVCIVLVYFLINRIRGERRRIREAREDAIKRSRSVLGGNFLEQIAPYLPDFKYDPTDAHFIGDPIDLIVFPGLANGEPEKVVFIEVKSGRSQLTPRERKVRDVIKDKKIEWELIQIPLQETK